MIVTKSISQDMVYWDTVNSFKKTHKPQLFLEFIDKFLNDGFINDEFNFEIVLKMQ